MALTFLNPWPGPAVGFTPDIMRSTRAIIASPPFHSGLPLEMERLRMTRQDHPPPHNHLLFPGLLLARRCAGEGRQRAPRLSPSPERGRRRCLTRA